MAVIEQTKKGDWAVWENNARYIARFPTEAEARAYHAEHYPAPAAYVRPEPKLTKLEQSTLALIERQGGSVVWPGLSEAASGLVRKGKATSARLAQGRYRVTLA